MSNVWSVVTAVGAAEGPSWYVLFMCSEEESGSNKVSSGPSSGGSRLMAKKFRKRPVVIEADQWTGNNFADLDKFLLGRSRMDNKQITIPTLEGMMTAEVGDWIIKGIKGEFYPIKDDIFRETYEFVSD